MPEGEYAVAITDVNGCTSSFSASVSAPVTADFSPSVDTAYISLSDSIRFLNASSGAISYQWNFGDTSAPDTAISPIHFYHHPGTYTASLISSDNLCSDTASYTIVVMDSLVNSIPYTSIPYTSIKVLYENGEIFLSFSLEKTTQMNISVYNMIGAQISLQNNLNVKNEKIRLALPGHSEGVYLVVFKMPDAVISRKIIAFKNAQ